MPTAIAALLGVIFIVILLTILWLKTLPTPPIEGFETQKIQEEIELDTYLKRASDVLCPTYERFLKEMGAAIDTKNPNSEEVKKKAAAALVEQAGGPLFPCPVPEDPLATPADIGERTSRSIVYFDKTLKTLVQQIDSSLSKCMKENFKDVCTKDQIKERALSAAAASCSLPTDISIQDKILILKTRKDAIARVLDAPTTPPLLEAIQKNLGRLETIKKQAEDGTLKPNCP
jgi:flagellar hook-basal body complex protein FliE